MPRAPDWLGADRPRSWRILQTDFGAGLEFLSCWAAWRADPARPKLLHIFSLSTSGHEIRSCAAQGHDHPDLAAELTLQCQGLLPGVHRLVFEQGRVLLTLWVGQTLEQWRDPDLEVDSLWLHGPLTGDVSRQIKTLARCCTRGSRLRSSSSSPELLAALPACGFQVLPETAQHPGVQAMFDPSWQPRRNRPPRNTSAPGRCTVLGAGLAGAACAASLARRGWQVTVLDRQGPAAGASGLPVGIMAPHVSPDDSPLSRLSRAGLRATLLHARQFLREGNDWAASGVMQRRLDADSGALPSSWPDEGRHWSEAAEGRGDLPAQLQPQALWHASGAWIKPARLVQAWLSQAGIAVRSGVEASALVRTQTGTWQVLDAAGQSLDESELIVLATAHETPALLHGLLGEQALDLQRIRGQVSWARQLENEDLPPWPVNGHGSLVRYPDEEGFAWLLGASFERGDTGCDIRPASHAANLEKLQTLLPQSAATLAPRFASGQVQGWAGVRCAYRDHLPVVGPLDAQQWPGLMLCTAFGSRGLSYSALCAELLAAWLHGEPLPLESRLAQSLQASRLLQGR